MDVYCLNDFPLVVGPLKTLGDDGKMVPVGTDLEVRMAIVEDPAAVPVVPVAVALDVALEANERGLRWGAFQGTDLDPAGLATHLDEERFIVVYAAGAIREAFPIRIRHPREGVIEE